MNEVNTIKKTVRTENEKLSPGALVGLYWADRSIGGKREGTAGLLPSQNAGFVGVMDVAFKSLESI